MQDATPVGLGSMAAVTGLEVDRVQRICTEVASGEAVDVANLNSPRQIVISGHTGAVERAIEMVLCEGGYASKLRVSAPFHSSLMEPAAAEFLGELERIDWGSPSVPIVSNAEATPCLSASRFPKLLAHQIAGRVRWVECVERMLDYGITDFIEIGPKSRLCKLIKQINNEVLCMGFNDAMAQYSTSTPGPDGRQVLPDGKIVWPDGMVWKPH